MEHLSLLLRILQVAFRFVNFTFLDGKAGGHSQQALGLPAGMADPVLWQ